MFFVSLFFFEEALIFASSSPSSLFPTVSLLAISATLFPKAIATLMSVNILRI
jgi:hypothetical protein